MDKNEIICRISKLRTRANFSARKLSQEIGMNDGYINRLECKRDFLPTILVLLDIIEVCGSTPAEFFYPVMEDYQKDQEIIKLLNKTNSTTKDAVLTILKENQKVDK